MKIAIVVQQYHKRGGVERHTVELVQQLIKKGHEVHVFTSEWECSEYPIIFHKIPVIKKPSLLRVLSFAIFSQIVLGKEATSFDIIHGQGPSFLRQQDVITAHSCHRYAVNFLRKTGNVVEKARKLLNPLHYVAFVMENYTYRRHHYRRIIAVGSGVKKELISCFAVPAGEIVTVPHGINLDEFNDDNRGIFRHQVRKMYNIPNDYFALCFVSNEFRRKNLEVVIKALPYIRQQEIKLLVIGRDNPTPYIRLAKSLRVEDKVIFTGPTLELNKYYNASDIFILPTRYEPFGMVITEAMACGLPVITTNRAGAIDFITNGKNGFIMDNPSDYKQLADMINTLIEDK
ncbi:TPA: glycosyltransferase family 1 protein, partial [Candidatus Bathyarchaeota archaeon]|nr:glycosyltransferase family 1 protein [Candidatus Bathyarchaeota archaeon]